MKEQIFIPNHSREGLAIPRQTVYAGLREVPRMTEVTSVESRAPKQPAKDAKTKPEAGEQKGESQASRGQQKESATPVVKNGEKRPSTIRRAEDLRQRLKPHLEEFKDRVKQLVDRREIADIKQEILDLHKLAEEIEKEVPHDLQLTKSLRKEYWEDVYESVKDVYEELTRQGVETSRFIDRELLVHEANGELVLPPEPAVLNYWENAFEKGQISREEADRAIRRGILPPPSGGAEPLNVLDFNDIQAQHVVEEINDEIQRVGAGEPLPEYFVTEQTERMRGLVDRGQVDPDEGRRILRSLGGWRVESQQAEAGVEEIEEGGRRRRRLTPEEAEERARQYVLDSKEAGTFDTDIYTDPVIGTIAREVKDMLGGLGVESRATNQYFKDKIDQLVGIRADPEYVNNPDLLRQAGILQGEVQSLKDTLAAKVVTEEGRMQTSLYGELRLNSQETKELVDLVLKAGNPDEDKAVREEADREIDRKFNRLFARADINTNDDWREALGSAGSLELDNFEMALGYAATGRALPQGQRLTPDQKLWLEKKIRQLNEAKKLREYLHSISYYINRNFTIEDIAKVVSNFTGEQADLAYREKGVGTVSRLYEQAMFQIITKRGGYLPYESMINKRDGTSGEVEALVREQIEVAKQMGELSPNMEDWEINRAISYARGMGIVSARFIEIVALAGVPQKGPLVSWWANDVIKKIAFFKQVARYNIGYEANKFLCFQLEGSAKVWSIKELTEVNEIGNEVAFGLTEKEGKDRFISMVNPFRIGSIFTQTRWRYIPEDLHHGGAIAALLEHYKNNPIIGAGMWVEKERMSMHSQTKLSNTQRETLRAELGEDARTEGEQAELRIKKNIELAAKISPLKFFYNLPWFQRSVLERYYISRLPAGEQSRYRAMSADDKVDFRRKLLVDMNDDLTALAIVQEKLLHERTAAYTTAAADLEERKRAWEEGGRQGAEPKLNLNLYEEHTNLSFDDVPEERRERVRLLADHITDEFLKDQHFNRLINDLRNKGWKVPFVLGVDDIPVELYDWTATGGSTHKRRWQSDIGAVSQAADAYDEFLQHLPKFSSQDDIINALDKIYQTLRGHDEGVTREVMFRTVEGITKFYKKGWQSRLPFLMGTAVGSLGGAASYAQRALGRQQLAWDETQTYDFIHKARAKNLITAEQLKELEKSTGSRAWQVGYDVGRTVSGLILAAMVFYMATKVLEEK